MCINFQADRKINTAVASFQIFYIYLFTTYTALDTTQCELFAASLNKESVHKISRRLLQKHKKLLFNPLKPELNPICYLLALLGAHHFLHVRRISVKLLTFRLLMSYIYIYIYIYIYRASILDVSRSHTTTQHSR